MSIVEQLVKDVIEKGWDAVVQVLGMERVLLHFMELVPLKDVTQESVVSFFEALEIVLEHLVFCFDDLHFSESELRVQAVLDIIQVEDFFPNSLDVEFLDQVLNVFLSHDDRGDFTIIEALFCR